MPQESTYYRWQSALPRFDLGIYAPLRDQKAEYVAFYGIDFERTIPGTRHYLGWLEVDAYRLCAHYFKPQYCVGCVFIVHGRSEHSGLYSHIIKQCLEANYSVFIFDLPGHGLSTGERLSINSFDDYQIILQEVLRQVGQQLPKNIISLGQSTGGSILMQYLLEQAKQNRKSFSVDNIFLAPLMKPREWPLIQTFWFLLRLRKTLARPPRDNSNNTEFFEFSNFQDPLKDAFVSVNWIGALRQWNKKIQRYAACKTPLTLVQGEQDSTLRWQEGVEFLKNHFQITDYYLLPNAKHQLANEREDIRQDVHHAIAKVLQARQIPAQ